MSRRNQSSAQVLQALERANEYREASWTWRRYTAASRRLALTVEQPGVGPVVYLVFRGPRYARLPRAFQGAEFSVVPPGVDSRRRLPPRIDSSGAHLISIRAEHKEFYILCEEVAFYCIEEETEAP